MIETIYLDMDGVLVDFERSACREHGLYVDEVYTRPGLLGSYPLSAGLNMTPEDFWEPIHLAGASFWTDLPMYPWAPMLIERCRDIAETVILSTPCDHPGSAAGKLAWLHTQFGPNFRDYMLGWKKELLAREATLLIDDHEENCEAFAKRGQSILFPGRCNKLHADRANPCPRVLALLDRLTRGERLAG